MQKIDTVIIGGGIIGKTISLELTLRNIKNIIVEDPSEKKTSSVAAGMIAPISEAVFNERTLIEPNLHSQLLWIELAKTLESITGLGSSLSNLPSLLVGKTPDDKNIIENLVTYYEKCDLRAQKLSISECKDLLLGLTPTFSAGALLISDLFVEPMAELKLIETTLKQLGTETIFSRAISIEPKIPRVNLTDGTIIEADQIILATGNSGLELLDENIDSKLQIIKVKGQIINLKLNDDEIRLNRVLRGFVNRTPIYLVPRGHNNIVVGATQENTGFDLGNTVDGIFNLLEPAINLFPALRQAEIQSIDFGFRPGTIDNTAYIGKIPDLPLYCAIGHYRHGVLQAPLTAEIVADQIEGKRNIYSEIFSPVRALS